MRSTEVNSMLGGLVLCHATFLGDIFVNMGVCSDVLVAFHGGDCVAPLPSIPGKKPRVITGLVFRGDLRG